MGEINPLLKKWTKNSHWHWVRLLKFCMPQLDKLSFATQYFWLTLFFFILYFLTVNFFVISVFKNIKLRNIIYKIWYFFLYNFDYSEYEKKNKTILFSSFSTIYYVIYTELLLTVKLNLLFNNKILDYLSIKSFLTNFINTSNITLFFGKNDINFIKNKLKTINIDEI